jgi:hypothetical protein
VTTSSDGTNARPSSTAMKTEIGTTLKTVGSSRP